MTFEQLFIHMEKYVSSPEERWKLVTRVKRGISDPKKVGCYSRDQCYFEGAIDILENLDEIDFHLLYSGKLCVDELPLIKEIVRTKKLKIPKFLRTIKNYKNTLRQIGMINAILGPNRVEDDASENIRKFIKNEINEVRGVPVTIHRMQEENIDANNSSLCVVL